MHARRMETRLQLLSVAEEIKSSYCQHVWQDSAGVATVERLTEDLTFRVHVVFLLEDIGATQEAENRRHLPSPALMGFDHCPPKHNPY